MSQYKELLFVLKGWTVASPLLIIIIYHSTACKCFEPGTKKPANHVSGEPISCDKNGKCECLENVKGDHCDECPAGHWNVKSGNGCEQCNCHPDGSIGQDCDVETGQCKCRPGVAGRTCNQCAPGHFEFSKDGCRGLLTYNFLRIHIRNSHSTSEFVFSALDFLLLLYEKDLKIILKIDFLTLLQFSLILNE